MWTAWLTVQSSWKKSESRTWVKSTVGVPATLEYAVGVPPARPSCARRYCSTPVIVSVWPGIGLLLASSAGAMPPPKVYVPLIEHELGAELEGVGFGGEDGVVVGFDVELVQLLRADGCAASSEGSGDLHLGRGGIGRVVLSVPAQAQARLMHKVCGGGGDVADAEHVLVLLAVVAGLGERGAAYAHVLAMVDGCAVGCDEGVLRAELPVQPRRSQPEALRCGYIGDGRDGVAGAVERDCIDDGEVVDTAMLEGEGEVAAGFAHGAGELEAVALFAEGGFAGGERIAGVLPRAAVGGEERAVVGLLAGLGVDLDARAVEGRLAVLGGELVGVDLDVGDGAFGREIA
jgi:hypothetical protein